MNKRSAVEMHYHGFYPGSVERVLDFVELDADADTYALTAYTGESMHHPFVLYRVIYDHDCPEVLPRFFFDSSFKREHGMLQRLAQLAPDHVTIRPRQHPEKLPTMGGRAGAVRP